ncbi:hypothetical protein ILUMI_07427 [Ignelater luminosus]|uniref:C2H2-type domain-containing protein n=1 Tax=Ignelater luminosus TaxID=2038154 RepID=A0A8K0D3H3_IGNLU|nr:hypothetical protein ILUMI_07427 [Ignelater luminosus]
MVEFQTLNAVKNPIICTNCVDILCDAYNFKKKCLQIEEEIYQCILKNNIKDNSVGIDMVFKWCEQNIKTKHRDIADLNSSANETHILDNSQTQSNQSQTNHSHSEEDEDNFCSEILNEIIQTADNINNSENSLDANMRAFSKSVEDVITNSQAEDKSHLECDKTNAVYEISDDSSDESNCVQIISTVTSNKVSTTTEKISTPIQVKPIANSQKNHTSEINVKDKKQAEKECGKYKEIPKTSSYGRNLKPKGKLLEYINSKTMQYTNKRQRRKINQSLKKKQKKSKRFHHITSSETNNLIQKGTNSKANMPSNVDSEISAETEDVNTVINPAIIDWNINEDIKTENIDIKEEEFLCIAECQEVSKPILYSQPKNVEVLQTSVNEEANSLNLNSQPQYVNIIAGMSCYLEDFSEFENRYSQYAINTSCSERLDDSSDSSFASKNTSKKVSEYSNENEHILDKGHRLRPAHQTNSENKASEFTSKRNKYVKSKHMTKTKLKKQIRLKCETCTFTTTFKSLMIQHRRKHQNETSTTHRAYICESCNVKTSGVFLTHMFNHGQQKCYSCDFKELDIQTLYKHMLEKHPNLFSFRCILCKSTNSKKSKVKSFKCSKCYKVFSKRSQLYCHVCVVVSNEPEHSYAVLPK